MKLKWARMCLAEKTVLGGPTGKSSVENYLRRQGTHCVIPGNRVKRTVGKSFHSRAH